MGEFFPCPFLLSLGLFPPVPRTKVKLKPAVPYLIFVLLFALVLVTLTVAALQVVVFGGLHHHLNSKNILKLVMTHII